MSFIFAANVKPGDVVRKHNHRHNAAFRKVADVLVAPKSVSILYEDGTRQPALQHNDPYEVQA